jgi:hypothetical protein
MGPAPDPFSTGQLPSAYPEAEPLPAVRKLLAEQVDTQFADIRALLRLPRDDVTPNVGCNITATAAIANQISGFSIWFFHNRYAQQLRKQETKRPMPISGKRFLGFVRAYYPRAIGEPQLATIARRLYQTRNLLSHNLGMSDLDRSAHRREVTLIKPDPPLTPSDIVDLELLAQFPLAGVPVRRDGVAIRFSVPGLYWALGRMLRAALADQPDRCEQQAERLVEALPLPVATT